MIQWFTNRLHAGMKLGRPLYIHNGVYRILLLGQGSVLTETMIEKLSEAGYRFVYVEEEGCENIVPEETLRGGLKESMLSSLVRFYEETRERSVDFIPNESETDPLYLELTGFDELREGVREMIRILMNTRDEHFSYASTSEFPRAEFIHHHVLNVAVLALILGIAYGFEPKELESLGMGALLHDLGKVFFPGITSKTFPELAPEERSQWYRHSVLGWKLLAGETALTDIERQIVIQHHERQDGTGFPSGLMGDHSKPTKKSRPMPGRIFRLAEIVSVADAFDNCVSGNPPGGPCSPEQALDALSKDTGSRLNSHVVRSLLNLITLFPTGRLVRILRHRDKTVVGLLGVVSRSDTASSREIEVRLFRDQDDRPIPPRSVRIDVDSNLYFHYVEMANA